MTVNEYANQLQDVVIVGGGASGLLVASELLRKSEGRARVLIVEPAAELGRGAAYSTPHQEHLLNVVAGRMGALHDDPDGFVRFLQEDGAEQANGPDAGDGIAQRFAPRRDYGRYLRQVLQAQPGYAQLTWHRALAVALEIGPSGYVIECADGQRFQAAAIVLALGNASKGLPAAWAGSVRASDRFDAWDHAAIERIDPNDDLAILGSGLSMVDVVVRLVHKGHRGAIHVVSRHGLHPLAHVEPGSYDGGAEELMAQDLRGRMRVLRTWVRQYQAQGQPWQWVMDRLRPHVQALWQSLSGPDQQRFLRHVVRYWDIHRHRIAPQIHAAIEQLRRDGQLRVHAGRLSSVDGASGLSLEIALRGGGGQTLRVDRLINATGVETNVVRSSSPLLRQLVVAGVLMPGPHGIGVMTDADGRVVGRDGHGAAHVYTLGSARIGQLWESVAIPEVRVQAEQIARHILARV